MVHRFLSSLRIIQPLVLLPTSDPSIREFEKKMLQQMEGLQNTTTLDLNMGYYKINLVTGANSQ